MEKIRKATLLLQEHILVNKYRGYDPYDTLLSPIFDWPLMRTKIVRFGAQQVFKRIPFNFRRVLSIPKGLNPVSLGLCLQAYSYLSEVFPDRRQFFLNETERLLDLLVENSSRGYSGICWGYDFDWEARYTKIDAYVPTGVATGIITNALFESYLIYPNERIKNMIVDAAQFVLKDLNRSYEGNLFCFSYSPLDQQFVLNASLKSARLLAQTFYFTQDESLKALAKTAVEYVANAQRESGAWPYALHDARKWADNYHTGYILDCMDSYEILCLDSSFKPALEKGLEYYIENFFENGEIPKFYDNNTYPVDSTAAAQSLLTLARFGRTARAEKVASWMISHMQREDGGFFFRKHKRYTDRNVFMRWNNAWMFAGLAYFLFRSNTDLNSSK